MLFKNILSIGIIFCGMFLATLFPEAGRPLRGMETPLLMIILFVSLLGIDLANTLRFIKRSFWHIVLLTLCKLFILPVIVYFVFKMVWPEFAVAALLVAGVSTGVSAPFVAMLAQGNRGFVAVLVVITSLGCVFTLPFLCKVLVGSDVAISSLGMLKTLCIIVFIPIICSEIARRVSPKLVRTVLGKSFFLNTFLFFVLGFTVFSQHAAHLHANPAVVLEAIAVGLIIAAAAFVCALLVARGFPLENQIAAIVLMVSINNFMVVVLASHFFGFREIIVSALYSIPFFLVVIPCQFYRRWYNRAKAN